MSKDTDELKGVTNFHCFQGTTATQMIESNLAITFNGFQTPESNFHPSKKERKGRINILKYLETNME